jgi:arylsulfatase A-like enzyme
VIEHIDTEVGRILETVRDLKLSDNTYIIYTTDNGPWLQFKNHGGSAGPLRAGKGTTFEGGQRVPCIMWAPGKIPAGSSTNAFTTTMDLLPTIAAITESKLPENRKIDGFDITSALTSDDSPRNEMVFYSSRGELDGIRVGDWKFLSPSKWNRKKKQVLRPETFLFNLADDLGEQTNLLQSNSEKAGELKARMEATDAEITANAREVWRKPEMESAK